MEGAKEFLEAIRNTELETSHFLAVVHILIGRKIFRIDGTLVSNGMSWRKLAELLKLIRWKEEGVIQLGAKPEELPPRDRFRYWLRAISFAPLNSTAVRNEVNALANRLKEIGYRVE